ncbi:MAG: helix-turn-helix transcriptional regulator [Verrucomicrobiota bacterium]
MICGESVEENSGQIGEELRKARETAGLSVDDIVSKARISRSVIEALEAEDFSVFASPTYAKSFLSQYSDFLGVDARLWLDALEPVAFQPGDVVSSSWQTGHSAREESRAEHASSGGWVAALGTLALSCGLILAAIKGYEFLEQRFGGDPGSLKVKREEPPETPPSEVPPVADSVETPATGLPAEVTQPPPRPTVVRENP